MQQSGRINETDQSIISIIYFDLKTLQNEILTDINTGIVKEYLRVVKYRDGIFKHLRSPGIDSKESILNLFLTDHPLKHLSCLSKDIGIWIGSNKF